MQKNNKNSCYYSEIEVKNITNQIFFGVTEKVNNFEGNFYYDKNNTLVIDIYNDCNTMFNMNDISKIQKFKAIVVSIRRQIGYDGVLFGLLVTKAVEIGAITPPVGLNAFVGKSMAPDVELREIFYGCVPFVFMELLIVALLIAFPDIALFAIRD